jgi:hypothetical protein
VNAVFYWPYRDNEVTASRDYQLKLGEHRYFRYNVNPENLHDVVVQAGAAGVWVRNVSCYDAEGGGKFCEGYLEPKYGGVTLGSLADKLFASTLEISLHPSGFVDEALQDLDDYLTMDYHTVHPVRMASQHDTLHPNSYYPTTLIYRGQRVGTWQKAPPPETVAAALREKGMGFYQPYKVVEPNSTTFILKTGDEVITPRQLALIMNADAAIVNLQTLDPTSQDLLEQHYTGETSKEAIVRFFKEAGEVVPETGEKLLVLAKYAALGAGLLGIAWLGLKAYPVMRNAYEDAKRKRVHSGA